MTKITSLLLFLFSALFLNAQTTIFQEDFESYDDFIISNIGNWTMYDLDGSPTWGVPECNFTNEGYTGTGIVFNPYSCTDDQMGTFDPTFLNYSIRDTGTKYLTFWCAQGVQNDNYFISPQIDLTNKSNIELTFYAKSLQTGGSGGFDPEQFEIMISTTGTNVGDFTAIGGVESVGTHQYWTDFSFNLDAYAGNQIYFAIHHITSQQGYALHMDDFKITANSTASVDAVDADLVTEFYPNPFSTNFTIKSKYTINNITFYNVIGKKVLSLNSNANQVVVNTDKLNSGIYFIKVNANNQTKTLKVVKK